MRNFTIRKICKLSYGDNFVKFNGELYLIKTMNCNVRFILDWVAKEVVSHDFLGKMMQIMVTNEFNR